MGDIGKEQSETNSGIIRLEGRFVSLEERLISLETKLEVTAGDIRDSLDRLVSTIEKSLSETIRALAGVDRVPTSVVAKLVTIFGVVVVGLLIALVFTLTGLKLGYLPQISI